MRLTELAILYLFVGIGAAAGLLALRRPMTTTTFVDAALLGSFWPLYGPFLLLKARDDAAAVNGDQGEAASRDLPLASLLPDQDTADALDRRLTLAQSRINEIDELLLRPELNEGRAQQRLEQLQRETGAASERATTAIRRRLASIQRLRRMRARFADELVEINELISQFRVQAEVVRLAGEDDGEASRELLNELHLRLETLDEMLGVPQYMLEEATAELP